MAAHVHQSVVTRATNSKAKYKIKAKKYQYITSDSNTVTMKYGYSRLLLTSLTQKYSYAV